MSNTDQGEILNYINVIQLQKSVFVFKVGLYNINTLSYLKESRFIDVYSLLSCLTVILELNCTLKSVISSANTVLLFISLYPLSSDRLQHPVNCNFAILSLIHVPQCIIQYMGCVMLYIHT